MFYDFWVTPTIFQYDLIRVVGLGGQNKEYSDRLMKKYEFIFLKWYQSKYELYE